MGRNGSQKLDFREPGSAGASHHLNHWEGNTKFLSQYILPVQLWDGPQLFQGTQGNSLDTEANFTQKSSSSLVACEWGRLRRLYHSEDPFRLAHCLHSAERITKQLLDYGHFWRQELKEKHQMKLSGPAHSNTVEDRNCRDSVSLLHSFHSIF